MARNNGADRVLLIDDDRMSREVLAVLLASEHYHVESADSGESALRLLRETPDPISVVLTDLQMPGLAGAELSAQLRTLCGPATVLLAMSGSDVPEDTAQAFDGFLLKPFHVRELAEAVQRCRKASAQSNHARISSALLPTSKHAVNPEPEHAGAGHDAASGSSLDERIYRQLTESMPAAQVQQLYAMCLEDVRRRITDMRGLAETRQLDQFARQAHAIKGGCGMLGASELYRMAGDLERAGIPTSEPQPIPSVNPLDELSSACDRLERILATRV